jgi:T5SS/PEP-CTERM-associated repeat protein
MSAKKTFSTAGLALFATFALAQDYSIDWFTIGGGGGTSSGEGYSMSGTIGDSGAGNMSGSGYTLDGGFWSPDTIFDNSTQVVADGATNTLNNVTNFIAGDVTVGNNGSFTLLILTNNALLTNSGHGYLGRNPGANSNTVRLAGANTRWLMSGNLYVGSNGVFNQLVISNSSTVSASNNVVVGFSSSASNNFLSLSTGAWLTNGGDGVLGWNPGANANSAFVSGTNSRWQVGNSLYVGSNGAFNQLVISNAGTLIAGSGLSVFTGGGVYVGANAAASNNLLSLSAGA